MTYIPFTPLPTSRIKTNTIMKLSKEQKSKGIADLSQVPNPSAATSLINEVKIVNVRRDDRSVNSSDPIPTWDCIAKDGSIITIWGLGALANAKLKDGEVLRSVVQSEIMLDEYCPFKLRSEPTDQQNDRGKTIHQIHLTIPASAFVTDED